MELVFVMVASSCLPGVFIARSVLMFLVQLAHRDWSWSWRNIGERLAEL